MGKRAVAPEQHSRLSLINAGKRLFAQKGFDGTTIREISQEADVNICLVSYHFNGKEGLYRTCLEQFGQARLASARRVLKAPTSIADFRSKLELFVDECLQAYMDDPEATRLIHRELERNCGMSLDIFEETFVKAFDTLVTFMKSAQTAGIMSKDSDPEIIGCSVFATVMHVTQNDWLRNLFTGKSVRDVKYRRKVRDQLVQMLISGVSA